MSSSSNRRVKLAACHTHAQSEQLRLLLILTEFPPRIGGMQTHAIYLSRHLVQRGYTVEVMTYRPANAEERTAVMEFDAKLPFPVHRCLSRLGFWHNLDLVARFAAEYHPHLVYASTVFYGLLGPYLGLPVVCRSVGNDVLRPWIAYPFRLGSRLCSTPWLERSLTNFFQRLERPEWVEALFRQARRRLMEQSAQATSRILANSRFTANLLESIGVPEHRVDVVVGGVEVSRFFSREIDKAAIRRGLGLPPDAYLIMTACRLEAKKGIDFLLQAFPQLCAMVPAAHLVIVGDGRYASRCQRLCYDLGLSQRVTFVGKVPHDEVHPYYWASDLFMLASREAVHPATGLRDVETMGRVLCEANAAGVPVVAACSGGIPSIITEGENGLLFQPEDTMDMLRQVRHIYEDPRLAAHLVAGGLSVARSRFDWQVVLEAHERAFAAALNGRLLPNPEPMSKLARRSRFSSIVF